MRACLELSNRVTANTRGEGIRWKGRANLQDRLRVLELLVLTTKSIEEEKKLKKGKRGVVRSEFNDHQDQKETERGSGGSQAGGDPIYSK